MKDYKASFFLIGLISLILVGLFCIPLLLTALIGLVMGGLDSKAFIEIYFALLALTFISACFVPLFVEWRTDVDVLEDKKDEV